MTLFEYLAIAFSLVFSSSAMRLVGGLSHAFHPQRRYWVQVAFVGLQLVATLGVFWGFWSYRDLPWNVERFALALAVPSLIYFNACVLIPENPETVVSWRDHYYAVRRKYFGGLVGWALLAAVTTTAFVQMPWLHPARIAQTAVLGAGLVGSASASHRVHAGLVLSLGALALLVLFELSRPGPLAP